MDKKKMLYLMHIDWNWIKQRPHYIEEGLEEYFDVTIICPRNYRIKERQFKKGTKVFYTIPFIRRFPIIWKIDLYRKMALIHRYIRIISPDVIYTTSPEYAQCIPNWYKGKVIYDCMDDMLAFNTQSHYVERVSKQESKMAYRADVILATSERLKSILCERYPEYKDKLILVRNGYDGNICTSQKLESHQSYTICYFGTISHWFNFDFITRSLNDIPDLQYLLIGPVEGGTNIPYHERLFHKPPVKHEKLVEATKDADAFIMPFELNDLILSVDPVKLYEYINFGKDILCVEYPEINRFSPFVYFYSDYEEFRSQIMLMKGTNKRKYSEEDRLSFLKQNDWEHRVETIIALLDC